MSVDSPYEGQEIGEPQSAGRLARLSGIVMMTASAALVSSGIVGREWWDVGYASLIAIYGAMMVWVYPFKSRISKQS